MRLESRTEVKALGGPVARAGPAILASRAQLALPAASGLRGPDLGPRRGGGRGDRARRPSVKEQAIDLKLKVLTSPPSTPPFLTLFSLNLRGAAPGKGL